MILIYPAMMTVNKAIFSVVIGVGTAFFTSMSVVATIALFIMIICHGALGENRTLMPCDGRF